MNGPPARMILSYLFVFDSSLSFAFRENEMPHPANQSTKARPWGAWQVHRRVVEAKHARCRRPRAREASGGLGRRAARSGRRRRDLNRATRRERKLGRYSLNHRKETLFSRGGARDTSACVCTRYVVARCVHLFALVDSDGGDHEPRPRHRPSPASLA